jgi:hypothetical protein
MTSSEGFLDRRDIVRIRVALDDNLDTLTHAGELIPDVAYTALALVQ